jgi:serine/threonine protein kinase
VILAALGVLSQAVLRHTGDISSIALGAILALVAAVFREEIRGLIHLATRGRVPRSVTVVPEGPPPDPADSASPGAPPTTSEADRTDSGTEPFLESPPTSRGPGGMTSDRATLGGDGPAGIGAQPLAMRSRGEVTIGGTGLRPTVADRFAPGLTPGSVLGDYRLEGRLGRGGWGEVYRARHLWLDREVALKVIAPSRLASEPAAARFSREMRAVGKLDHPHLVRATDARRVGPWHLLVMELLDGIDLERLIRRVGSLSVADACEVARQAAEGLQHAHERGVVHRDVKPSNLMLTRGGTVKVLDLGLARLQGVGEGLTPTRLAMGTPDYMAPEQVQESRGVTPRSDLYSLGCMLYHFLAGRPPFHDSPTTIDKMLSHRSTPAPPLCEWRSDLPEGLVGVLDHLLAKDPADRPGSAREVSEAMRPWCLGADLSGLLDRALRGDPTAPSPPILGEEIVLEPTEALAVLDREVARPEIVPEFQQQGTLPGLPVRLAVGDDEG